jgi:hypothetical protein
MIRSWLPILPQSPLPNQYVPSQCQMEVGLFGSPTTETATSRWNRVSRPVPMPNVHLASTRGPGWFQLQTPVVLPFFTMMVGYASAGSAP